MSTARLPPQVVGPTFSVQRDRDSHTDKDKQDIIMHIDGRSYRMKPGDWSRALAQFDEAPAIAIDPVSWRSTTT